MARMSLPYILANLNISHWTQKSVLIRKHSPYDGCLLNLFNKSSTSTRNYKIWKMLDKCLVLASLGESKWILESPTIHKWPLLTASESTNSDSRYTIATWTVNLQDVKVSREFSKEQQWKQGCSLNFGESRRSIPIPPPFLWVRGVWYNV